MSAFKVGDRVTLRDEHECDAGTIRPGVTYRVDRVDGAGWIVLSNDTRHPGDEFELVEPAEVEQASAILDGQQDDGWWNVPGVTLLRFGKQFEVTDAAAFAAIGLEMRVQVRRVQS